MWYSIFVMDKKTGYDQRCIFNGKAKRDYVDKMYNEICSLLRSGEKVMLLKGKRLGKLIKEDSL